MFKKILALSATMVSIVCMLAMPTNAEEASDRYFDALVKVTAKIPSEARTSSTLGAEREGTGVVLDNDGLVVTAGYIILEANSVSIKTSTGIEVSAKVVAYDDATGLGVIRAIQPLNVRPLELGDSRELQQKQRVLVAAHGGIDNAIGAYIVDRRDYAGYWEYLLNDAIFTWPPSPLFGGAALINNKGMLVGIGSLLVPNAVEEEGSVVPGNMFIPIDSLKAVLGDLIAEGRSFNRTRPWLGLYSEMVRGRLFVARVAKNGPAWVAGIRTGDMVLGVAGKPVTNLKDFYQTIWALGDPGVEVPLLVLRGNEPMKTTITSMDRYEWLQLKPTF
ncbi:MAG: S1C family serine protease [Pseudomonadota bacterium]|nr:S1C family serine protease [Pseudomonadota bacterium]